MYMKPVGTEGSNAPKLTCHANLALQSFLGLVVEDEGLQSPFLPAAFLL